MPSEHPDNRDRDDRDRDREYRPARRDRDRDDDDYDRPRRSRRSDDQSQVAVTILGVLSLVKGIMALITSVIPCFGMFAIGLASISLLLGIIGIVIAKSKNQSMALPIAGTAVSGLAVAFSLLWFLVVFGSLKGLKDGVEKSAEKEREQREAARVEIQNGPAISITAVELYDDYDTNERQADAKYKGKVLEITGKVVRVTDLGFDFTVELEGDETNRGCTVKCEFHNEQRHALVAIKAKQTVKIRGRCRWKLNRTVYVEDCVLVQ